MNETKLKEMNKQLDNSTIIVGNINIQFSIQDGTRQDQQVNRRF